MAKSIASQKLLIQKETTPGTPAVNAMKQLLALGGRPGWNIEFTDFSPPGWKLATVRQQTNEWGVWDWEGIQDFNHLGLVAASRIHLPVTSTPDGATDARQHVFALVPSGPDTKATYTVQFGDTDRAIQAEYGVFQSLGFNVQRGQLSFDTSFISRTPHVVSSVATSGVTTVAAAPTAARQFDIYADDAWEDLGTTKLLAAYEGGITMGDKFAQDAPIDSSITSYQSLVEAEDQSYTGTLRVGFDATAEGLIDTFEASALKFIRIVSIGPEIEDGFNYLLQLDLCCQIVPKTAEKFGAGVYTLPFDFTVVPDPVSSSAVELMLVNTVTAY